MTVRQLSDAVPACRAVSICRWLCIICESELLCEAAERTRRPSRAAECAARARAQQQRPPILGPYPIATFVSWPPPFPLAFIAALQVDEHTNQTAQKSRADAFWSNITWTKL